MNSTFFRRFGQQDRALAVDGLQPGGGKHQRLAHHGFRKVLLVNGHGSNVPFLDIAARNITNRSEAICALISWWSLVPKELFNELR